MRDVDVAARRRGRRSASSYASKSMPTVLAERRDRPGSPGSATPSRRFTKSPCAATTRIGSPVRARSASMSASEQVARLGQVREEGVPGREDRGAWRPWPVPRSGSSRGRRPRRSRPSARGRPSTAGRSTSSLTPRSRSIAHIAAAVPGSVSMSWRRTRSRSVGAGPPAPMIAHNRSRETIVVAAGEGGLRATARYAPEPGRHQEVAVDPIPQVGHGASHAATPPIRSAPESGTGSSADPERGWGNGGDEWIRTTDVKLCELPPSTARARRLVRPLCWFPAMGASAPAEPRCRGATRARNDGSRGPIGPDGPWPGWCADAPTVGRRACARSPQVLGREYPRGLR